MCVYMCVYVCMWYMHMYILHKCFYVFARAQVIRSKTKNGFVPNYAAAGAKSQDRSEELIGSKVVLLPP